MSKKNKRFLKNVITCSLTLMLISGTIPNINYTPDTTVTAHAEEDETPILPPVTPTTDSFTPDFTQTYSETWDKNNYATSSGGGDITLPFVPIAKYSGTFSNGVKWESYIDDLYFPYYSGGALTVPDNAISIINNTSPYAWKSVKSMSMSYVANIGNRAFDCTILNTSDRIPATKLSFGSSLTSIGNRAFAECSVLTNIVFPENLTNIGSEAFNAANTSITFSGCKSVEFGENAFASLTSDKTVLIPYGSVFVDSNGVSHIITPDSNGKYEQVFGQATVTLKDEYTLVPRVEPTCEKRGNIEYYINCSGECCVLENGNYTVVNKSDTVISPTGHSYEFDHVSWQANFYKDSSGNYPDTPNSLAGCINKTCTVCGKETPFYPTTNSKTLQATCTGNARKIYWINYTDEKGEEQHSVRQLTTGNALGHNFGTPVYNWSEDYQTVTASRVCKNDETHIETETVNTTSEITKPATATENSETTYTATFTNPAFETQTLTIENTNRLLQANTVSFKDNLGLNFLASLSENNAESAYVKFTYNHYGTEKTVVVNANSNDKLNNFYRFRCELTASELTIPVTAELYVNNSEEPVSTWTRSIRDYCITGLNNENTPNYEKALLRATLNYGGYTQANFQYNGEPYAYEDYRDNLDNVAVTSEITQDRPRGEKNGIEYVGSTVFFRTAPFVRYYFKAAESTNISDYTFTLDGSAVTPTYYKTNAKYKYYYFDAAPALAYQLDNPQNVVVSKGNTEIFNFNYNAIKWAEYAAANTTNDNERSMVKSLYAYYQVAKTFVNSKG